MDGHKDGLIGWSYEGRPYIHSAKVFKLFAVNLWMFLINTFVNYPYMYKKLLANWKY